MSRGKRVRLTREEAMTLYPDEWVVCCDPRYDEKTGAYLDGVVCFHGKDREEAYRMSAEVVGDRVVFHLGKIPYRRISSHTDDLSRKKAA